MTELIDKYGLYKTTNNNVKHKIWLKIQEIFQEKTGKSIALPKLRKKWENDQKKLRANDRKIKTDKKKTGKYSTVWKLQKFTIILL